MRNTEKNNLATLLEVKKMSQKDLSKLSGITESAISRYVSGERVPRGVNLIKISQALEISTDELLGANTISNKEKDLSTAKLLIARNAAEITAEEKMELIQLLMEKK